MDNILKNNVGLKISKEELLKLFTYATLGTHFLFNDNFYEQVGWVGMGLPLAPTLGNYLLDIMRGSE